LLGNKTQLGTLMVQLFLLDSSSHEDKLHKLKMKKLPLQVSKIQLDKVLE